MTGHGRAVVSRVEQVLADVAPVRPDGKAAVAVRLYREVHLWGRRSGAILPQGYDDGTAELRTVAGVTGRRWQHGWHMGRRLGTSWLMHSPDGIEIIVGTDQVRAGAGSEASVRVPLLWPRAVPGWLVLATTDLPQSTERLYVHLEADRFAEGWEAVAGVLSAGGVAGVAKVPVSRTGRERPDHCVLEVGANALADTVAALSNVIDGPVRSPIMPGFSVPIGPALALGLAGTAAVSGDSGGLRTANWLSDLAARHGVARAVEAFGDCFGAASLRAHELIHPAGVRG